jgi:hypothetical protein
LVAMAQAPIAQAQPMQSQSAIQQAKIVNAQPAVTLPEPAIYTPTLPEPAATVPVQPEPAIYTPTLPEPAATVPVQPEQPSVADHWKGFLAVKGIDQKSLDKFDYYTREKTANEFLNSPEYSATITRDYGEERVPEAKAAHLGQLAGPAPAKREWGFDNLVAPSKEQSVYKDLAASASEGIASAGKSIGGLAYLAASADFAKDSSIKTGLTAAGDYLAGTADFITQSVKELKSDKSTYDAAKLADQKGFVDTLSTIAHSPGAHLPGLLLSSLPSMAVGAALGGSAGEGLLMAGSKAAEFHDFNKMAVESARDILAMPTDKQVASGITPDLLEKAKKTIQNGVDISAKQALSTAAVGVGGFAAGKLGGKLGDKIGVGDIDP